MTSPRFTGLLLVTDRKLCPGSVEDAATRAVDAGFRGVMLREKDLPGGRLLEMAAPFAAMCRAKGVVFLVNDRVDVALALPRAGAHVGTHGLPVPQARAMLGPDRLLGYSAHEIDEAGQALDEGADYVTLSPVNDPISKPGTGRGMDFLREAVTRIPADRVVALGGLRPHDLAGVSTLGVAGAAVLGGIMGAPDPGVAAAAYVASWSETL